MPSSRADISRSTHDRVQTFLAAEVFVDDGFGDVGTLGDLLDGRAVVAALGEQRLGDLDELLTRARCRSCAREVRALPSPVQPYAFRVTSLRRSTDHD